MQSTSFGCLDKSTSTDSSPCTWARERHSERQGYYGEMAFPPFTTHPEQWTKPVLQRKIELLVTIAGWLQES